MPFFFDFTFHARGRSSVAVVGLAAVLMLSGCTTHNNSAGSGGANSAVGSILRYPITAEPTTLDPGKVEDGTTIDLLQQVFEGLVAWGDDNKIHGNLAEKWEISADRKTYTFHLKSGVKFHNGRELTANDFKYSMERACNPALKSVTAPGYLKDIVGVKEVLAGKATEISGIKAPDKNTLQITIDGAKPYWLGNMTYPCSFAICKEEVEKHKDGGVGQIDERLLTSTTGTGPFKFDKVLRGDKITLTAFADYHEGRAKLDGIERPIVIDAAQRINKYAVGSVDIVEVSPSDLDRINSDPKLKGDLKTFARAAVWYVAMNQESPDSPFKNLKVRQAFTEAIDKSQIIAIAMKGTVDPANGILPPGVPGRNETIVPLPYDPAKAKQLLAEAGYPDGKGFPVLTISFRNDYPDVRKSAELIVQQLKSNLNIDVQVRPVEPTQFFKERDQKTQPLAHLRWSADYLDPQNFLSTLLRKGASENKVGYDNAEFNQLCDAADSERDEAKRFALYQKAEQIAVTDAPFAPLYFKRDLELVSPKVGNLHDSLFGHRPHFLTTVTR